MTDAEITSLPGYELYATDLGYEETIGSELDPSTLDIFGLSDETSFEEEEIKSWLTGLKRKKQAIFYGPPGTGKTYTSDKLAKEIVDGTDGFKSTVQFHQGYEYEDFIQGIRPNTGNDGNLTYELEPGTFLEFCKEAKDRNSPCVLIIDEINRADVSSVFGELMYLLEYREEKIRLAQNDSNVQDDDDGEEDEDQGYEDAEKFEIPGNVYIVGTMNTADRSIALVDFALRRRFAFLSLQPNWDVLRDKFSVPSVDVDVLVDTMEDINSDINDQNYSLGHTYFIGESVESRDDLRNVWELEVIPYLEEYFIDQEGKVEQYRWNNVTDPSGQYNL